MTLRIFTVVFAATALMALGACQQKPAEPPKPAVSTEDSAKAKAAVETAAKEKEAQEAASDAYVSTAAPKAAQDRISAWFVGGVKAGDAVLEDGWSFTRNTGTYGTNYLQRALVTWFGLGANRPQDAIYPTSEVDAAGKPYDGANKYMMRFGKGQMPPADGFWSLTMYNAEYFFVANPLNRYNVSSRSKFKTNKDGSIDIYIQNESPGKDKESNWLPAPKDKFVLMLRMYWPREKPPSLLDGTWKIPPVTKAT